MVNKIDKDVLYTLKQGAARAGYNLHYFRRQCRSKRFASTPIGAHIYFTTEQYQALPKKGPARRLPSIFDGLEA